MSKALLIQKQNESWNLGSLANDCVPISFREPAYWRNKFSKIHRLKQRKGPNYPEHEYGNTSKQYYLVWIDLQVHNWRKSETFWSRGENQQSDVLNLFGRTATLTPEVEWCRVQTIPRALPFWNDVPVLLLNLSIINANGTFAKPWLAPFWAYFFWVTFKSMIYQTLNSIEQGVEPLKTFLVTVEDKLV